jgi:phage terminase small subunit
MGDTINAYTIKTFCASHSISPSAYFQLKKEGRGPREMRVGRAGVRISAEAAAEWRRRMEQLAEVDASQAA